MATYGPNAGFVPFTGFSPTLGAGDAIVPALTGSAQFNGITQSDTELSRLLWTRANRGVRRLLLTLLGAATGGTATETYTRIQASQALSQAFALGGLVPVEVVTQINRATTAADLNNIVQMFSRTPVVAYVADVSGNGGGSKLGY